MITLLLVLFFISSGLLIFAVIVQSQREGHLDMFGGTGTPFGVQGSSVLNKITTTVGIIFFIVVFLLSFSYNKVARTEKQKFIDLEKQEQIDQNKATINVNPDSQPINVETPEDASDGSEGTDSGQ